MKSAMPRSQDGYIPDYLIRTDLAMEAQEVIRERAADDIPGVKVETVEEDDVKITRVNIRNKKAAEKLGKPPGNYVTIEAAGLRSSDSALQEHLSSVLSKELGAIAGKVVSSADAGEKFSILVVGLGNWNVTPDSLGPRVVEDILVTRHILKSERINKERLNSEGYRDVSAFSPGVMGVTGIETADIIKSVVKCVKPALIIAVDALAAFRLERLHTTVQIADTGVSPGSGVHNKRMEISKATMGVPVIAIGVPTVVEASTIAGYAMNALVEALKSETGTSGLGEALQNFNPWEKEQLINEVFEPCPGQLMVTPKEIDSFIDDISISVAGGLNSFLHPVLDNKDSGKYLQ